MKAGSNLCFSDFYLSKPLDLLNQTSDLRTPGGFCCGLVMEKINCGTVAQITMVKQSVLMCAGGEAWLVALLVSALVKSQFLGLSQECMKLLENQPKLRGDGEGDEVVDAGDKDTDEDEDGEGDDDDDEDDERIPDPNDNKSGPTKGNGGGPTSGAQENGEDEDDEQEDGGDPDEDDDDEADDDEDDDEDAEDGGDEEGVVEEEEDKDDEDDDEDEEEEDLQPPKKRKK